MNDRLAFLIGLKETVERKEEEHRAYLNEGYIIENHFSFDLYEFRGLLSDLYQSGDLGKLADYFELFGTANRNLYRTHPNHFWWIYPSFVWLLCSSFYNYRIGNVNYASNLARFNYFYLEELRPRLAYDPTYSEIGYTERGMFNELMGYFSLLFEPSRFEIHMREAKCLIEHHVQLQEEVYAILNDDEVGPVDEPGGINEETIVFKYNYDQAHGPLSAALYLCFDINERTYRFAEREQIFERLKEFFTAMPDWNAMGKPTLNSSSHFFMNPDQ